MNKKQLYKEIGSIDADLIEEANTRKKENILKRKWVKLVSAAACFLLTAGIGISAWNNHKASIDLPLSTGDISAKYIDKAPVVSKYQLVWMTEKELFTKFDTTIFKGTITEIKNIQINFNGSKDYRAVAKIKVSDTYRGNCNSGDIITVLLPCPIDVKGFWVEDTNTISAMRVGMEGIFMPIQYNENSYREENGAKLYLKDIADYGLLDGSRYVFIKSDNSIIFARDAYQSISTAISLEEIERYIKTMIE